MRQVKTSCRLLTRHFISLSLSLSLSLIQRMRHSAWEVALHTVAEVARLNADVVLLQAGEQTGETDVVLGVT
jgi:hypothetical protein